MEKEKEKKPQPTIRSVSIDEWRTLYPESESHKYDFIPVRAFITKMGINPITFRRRSDRGDIIAVHWPEKAPGTLLVDYSLYKNLVFKDNIRRKIVVNDL